MLGLLWSIVGLLLALLSTSSEPGDASESCYTEDVKNAPQHKVKSRLLLDIVVAQRAAVFELLSGKDETLLVRGNALFVLDLSLDIVDGVRGFDLD